MRISKNRSFNTPSATYFNCNLRFRSKVNKIERNKP